MQRRFPLKPNEVAKLLRVTTRTLTKWRSQGIGPPFVRLTDKDKAPIVYWRGDIERYMEDMRSGAVSVEETKRLREENRRLAQALNALNDEKINAIVEAHKSKLKDNLRGRYRKLKRSEKDLEEKQKAFEEEISQKRKEIALDREHLDRDKAIFERDAFSKMQAHARQIDPNHVYDEYGLGVVLSGVDDKPYAMNIGLHQLIPSLKAGYTFAVESQGKTMPVKRVLTIFRRSRLVTYAVGSMPDRYKPQSHDWSLICAAGVSANTAKIDDLQQLFHILKTFPLASDQNS